jgi:hypothetical protein
MKAEDALSGGLDVMAKVFRRFMATAFSDVADGAQ